MWLSALQTKTSEPGKENLSTGMTYCGLLGEGEIPGKNAAQWLAYSVGVSVTCHQALSIKIS